MYRWHILRLYGYTHPIKCHDKYYQSFHNYNYFAY